METFFPNTHRHKVPKVTHFVAYLPTDVFMCMFMHMFTSMLMPVKDITGTVAQISSTKNDSLIVRNNNIIV